MTSSNLSRKERERLRHKEEILTIALELFSKKCFHDVSMQEIAEKSEFAVGTLYKFFENKEALFAKILGACAHRIAEILNPILDNEIDEKQKIVNYIDAHKKIVIENAPSIRLYISQNLPSTLILRPEVELETDAVKEIILQKLLKTFKSGISKGIFKDIDPWITTLSLSAILESFIFSAVKYPETVSIDKGILSINELFLKGILEL